MADLTFRITDDTADALMKALLEDCAELCASSIREAIAAIAKGGSSHHTDNLWENFNVFEAASTLMKYYTGEPLKLHDVMAKLPPIPLSSSRRPDASRPDKKLTAPSRAPARAASATPKRRSLPPVHDFP